MAAPKQRSVLALWPIPVAFIVAMWAGGTAFRWAVGFGHSFLAWLLQMAIFVASIALWRTLHRWLRARIDPDGKLWHRATTFGADAED